MRARKDAQPGRMTREEATKVSRYVERDPHEASFIADTGQEFVIG